MAVLILRRLIFIDPYLYYIIGEIYGVRKLKALSGLRKLKYHVGYHDVVCFVF